MYRIIAYWGIVTFGLTALCGCAAQTPIGELTGIRNAIAAVSARIDETHQEADQTIANVSGSVKAAQTTINTTFDAISLRMLIGGAVSTVLAMFGYLFAKPIHEWRMRHKNGQRERYKESMRKP